MSIEVIKNISIIVGTILSCIALFKLIIQPIRKSLDLIKEIPIKIDTLNKRMFENEKDRLRGELFNCGNRCRRGIPLYPEEFRFIQGVYQKYSEELHCNSIGTDEYHFIERYFNSKSNQSQINTINH